MRKETLVQLSDDLVDELDRRAADLNISRSAVIRHAVEQYLAQGTAEEIDRRIVDGYTRFPQEDIWGDAPLRALIQAEPW